MSSQTSLQLQSYWKQELSRAVAALYSQGSGTLAEACAYAMEGNGKGVRPLLTLLCHQMFCSTPRFALRPALAVEWVHTYSLVHDDLPSMDNDDLRRGRATVHRVYPEAIAVLVGDTLQSDAFALLTGAALPFWEVPLYDGARAVGLLSRAIGTQGMAGGQALDMELTRQSARASREQILTIHRLKTASLLGAACALGGVAGHATPLEIEGLRLFGEHMGLAFQVIDDLLDDSPENGKTQGKDLAQGKLTILQIMSRREAETFARELTAEAYGLLSKTFGETSTRELRGFVQGLLVRRF